MAASSQQLAHDDDVQGVSTTRILFHKLSEGCRSMAQVLGIRRLHEFIQGTTTLSNEAVWLLGTYYAVRDANTDTEWLTPEMREMLLADFSSRLWFTYRRDFPALGTSGWTTDSGWGCTLRTGQMMLAEALLRHVKGRLWARGELSALDPFVLQLLTLFWDSPSEATPFSLHHLCTAGAAAGTVPGKWLGPWQMCKALEAAVNTARPHGLRVHVLCEPGGGAPSLPVQRVRAMLPSKDQQEQQQRERQQQQQQEASATAAAAAASVSNAAEQQQQQQEEQQEEEQQAAGSVKTPLPAEVAAEAQEAEAEAGVKPSAEPQEVQQHDTQQYPEPHPSPAPSSSPTEAQQQQQQQPHRSRPKHKRKPPQPPSPLLLLVPITLGLDAANPRYLPQLQCLLQSSFTVGIVGGRPGSSLYFLGTQGDSLLYMDPHQTQHLAQLPDDIATYFCDTMRLMPLAAIDPSMALGFYCRHQQDLEQLAQLLQQLQAGHQDAPLLTVDLAAAAASRQGSGAAAGRASNGADGSGSETEEEEEEEEGGHGAGSAATASEASGFVAADGSKDAEDWELV